MSPKKVVQDAVMRVAPGLVVADYSDEQLFEMAGQSWEISKLAVIELGKAKEDGGRGYSVREIGERTGIAKSTVQDWLTVRIRTDKKAELPPPKPNHYRTLIVDPPWPIDKIRRDVRPNQVNMDYETWDLERIAALHMGAWADDHAHLYLWTTHKHLPNALDIVEAWGFNYQCILTWVKNVGITPFSWMYSTELALFCRRGNLDLLELGRRLDFNAKVREHSRKPDEFYDLVRSVSPGPRLDVFSREDRMGFDSWGNESGKFAMAEGQGVG